MDELSGFIVAVALVRPTKSIHDVEVRAVNREDIIRGADQLDMPLDTVIAEVITALTSDAERLGLTGITH